MGRGDYSKADRAAYVAYIASPEWRRRKRRAISLAGERCQFEEEAAYGRVVRCTRARYLCVHHLTYDRLGHEADEDLEVLCWPHHMAEHVVWNECDRCHCPVVGGYPEALRWVFELLAAENVDVDSGPVDWKRLPSKLAIDASLPRLCAACGPELWEGLR